MNEPPKTLGARFRKAVAPAAPETANPNPTVLPRSRTGNVPLSAAQQHLPAQPQEALPVLEAFQKFLDTERRKTRRRLLAVSMSFLIVLVGIVAGATWMGVVFFTELRHDFDDIEGSVSRSRENTLRIQEDAEKTLKAVETQRQEMRTDLEQEKRELSSTQSEIESQMRHHTTALDEIRAMVDTLQAENKTLKKTIAQIGKRPSDTRRPKPAQVVATPVESNTVTAIPDNTPESVLNMAVAVGDAREEINWRVPIPE